MARSLGISLQPDGFTYALVEGTAKKYALKASGDGLFSADGARQPKTLGRVIADTLKGVGKVDQVSVSLPTTGVVMRELGMPFSDREKVMQVLKFEVESELYHLDIEDVLADFIRLRDDRATPSLLVSVVPKDHVSAALEIADGADWDPAHVTVTYGALANALGELPAEEEDAGLSAVLYLGSTSSVLLLLNPDRSLRAARSIPVGWRELARGLERPGDAEDEIEELEVAEPADSDDLEEVDAEEEPEDEEEEGPVALFAADPSLPYGVTLEEALQFAEPARREQFLRRLANEVRRGIEAMDGSVSRLGLIGAEIPGLDEFLAGRLRQDVEWMSLEASAGADGPADPAAYGAALTGLGIEHSEMNFRQEEFRYARGLERVEGPLTFALVGLIAFLVVDLAVNVKTAQAKRDDANLIYAEANRRVNRLNEQVEKEAEYPQEWIIRNDLSGLDVPPERRIHVLADRVEDAKEQLDRLMGEAELEMPQSCLEAWRILMDFLAREMADYPNRWMLESLDLSSVDGNQRTPAHVDVSFGLTLFADNPQLPAAQYDQIETALNAAPWIVDGATIPTTEAADVAGARTATVNCKISVQQAKAAARGAE